MNKIIFIIMVLMITSCGAKKAHTTIDPAFVKYVQNFQLISSNSNIAAPKTVTNIEISLRSDLGQGVAGLCYKDEYADSFWNQVYFTFNKKPEEQRHVEIDQAFWDKSTDAQREAVIFHELGHCILNRDHVNGYDNTHNRYYSIMNSAVFMPTIYTGNYQYYMRELFKSKFFNPNETSVNPTITFNATYYNPNALTSIASSDNLSDNLNDIPPDADVIDSYEEALTHSDNHPCQIKSLEEYESKMEERKLQELDKKE
jgi:hypothetical protein